MRTILYVAEMAMDYIQTADATSAVVDASAAQKRSLCSIITATLQELYRIKPEVFGGQRGAIIAAPQTGNVGFTANSPTINLSAFAGQDLRGRTLASGGVFYQIAITAAGVSELVTPWRGATGTFSSTIYCDSIPVDATAFNVIGDVVLDGFGPMWAAPDRNTFLAIRQNFPVGDYGTYRGILINVMVGQPWAWWVESGYLATEATRLYLHVAPLPTLQPYPLSYTLSYRPRELVPADLTNASLVLPMPGDFVDSILVPCVLQRWTGTPWFRNQSALKEISRQYTEAKSMLSNWGAQDNREIRIIVPAF